MTKYSDRLDLDDNEMQSDMAEGSAAWADGDQADDFPEASGSGSGPGKRRKRWWLFYFIHGTHLYTWRLLLLNSSHGSTDDSSGRNSGPGQLWLNRCAIRGRGKDIFRDFLAHFQLLVYGAVFVFCIFNVAPMNFRQRRVSGC